MLSQIIDGTLTVTPTDNREAATISSSRNRSSDRRYDRRPRFGVGVTSRDHVSAEPARLVLLATALSGYSPGAYVSRALLSLRAHTDRIDDQFDERCSRKVLQSHCGLVAQLVRDDDIDEVTR